MGFLIYAAVTVVGECALQLIISTALGRCFPLPQKKVLLKSCRGPEPDACGPSAVPSGSITADWHQPG